MERVPPTIDEVCSSLTAFSLKNHARTKKTQIVEEPALTCNSSHRRELVSIRSGSKSNPPFQFFIRINDACVVSPVFRAALTGPFVEAQKHQYIFEGFGNEEVELLQQWLFFGRLTTNSAERGSSNDSKVHSKLVEDAIRLWCIGEHLIMPELQDAAMLELHKSMEESNDVPLSMLNFVWENIPAGSALRRYLVDDCVSNCTHIWYTGERAEKFPKEMLLEMIVVFTKNRSRAVSTSIRPGQDISRYLVLEK